MFQSARWNRSCGLGWFEVRVLELRRVAFAVAEELHQDGLFGARVRSRDIGAGVVEGAQQFEFVVDPEGELRLFAEFGVLGDGPSHLARPEVAALFVDGSALERTVAGGVVDLRRREWRIERRVRPAAVDSRLFAAFHDVEDFGDEPLIEELLDGAHVGGIGFATAETRRCFGFDFGLGQSVLHRRNAHPRVHKKAAPIGGYFRCSERTGASEGQVRGAWMRWGKQLHSSLRHLSRLLLALCDRRAKPVNHLNG